MLALILMAGCGNDPAPTLRGQNNARITFYGLAVDQDGTPLPGASFDIVVDAIPKDWSFETRGKPHDRTHRTVVTDADGRFSIEVNAHLIYIENVHLSGYRHLFAQWSDDGNTGYQITSWSDLLYKTDPDHPAVYVLVKDGVHEVSALPCRGGFRSYGKRWILNKPAWPKRPSLKDVVHKPPTTTQATTKP